MSLAGWFTVGEIAVLVLAASVTLHRLGRSAAESFSMGVILAFMALSATFQFWFLVRAPRGSYAFELALGVAVVWTLWRNRKALVSLCRAVVGFWRRRWMIAGVLAICWSYLFWLVVAIPPSNWDSMTYNLARVLLFQQENSLLLSSATTPRQAVFPAGYDILSHMFLRRHADHGVAIFSLLSYMSVVAGTYAFCRKHFTSEVSLASALTVASFPLVVFQATSTKPDLATGAIAVFCGLLASNLFACFRMETAGLLLLGLLFGVSVKPTFGAFLIPFILIFGLVGIARWSRSRQPWRSEVRWLNLLWVLPPALLLSSVWTYVHNRAVWGGWLGPPAFVSVSRQPGGLAGAAANVMRHLLQTVDFLPAGQEITRRMARVEASYYVERVYHHVLFRFWGDAGSGGKYGRFSVIWCANEDAAWFGPLGILLAVPGVIYAIIRGPLWFRAWGLVLAAYFLLISSALVWSPWNGRYLTLCFAASGLCVGLLLAKVSARFSWALRAVQACCCLLLIYACVANDLKPLFQAPREPFVTSRALDFRKWPEWMRRKSVWAVTQWGRDRLYYARLHYGDDRVEQFGFRIPHGARVALLAGDDSWIYHFLLTRPDVRFMPMSLEKALDPSASAEYILCLDEGCNGAPDAPENGVLWGSARSKSTCRIIRLDKRAAGAVALK